MTQYRIEWINLSTNYTSYGDWHDSKEFIESCIEDLNKRHKGVLNHRIGKK